MVKKRSDIKKIVLRYITELERQGVAVSQIILFGSYAEGSPSKYSDIDLAVVSQVFSKLDIFERQQVLCKAHHNFGEPLDPLGFTPAQIRGRKGFVREIVDKGVVLFEK